jgi:pyruvate/2-oxoglutarate dehydrogenase complex dihydrolipoamide dehydrogenase (E3) component
VGGRASVPDIPGLKDVAYLTNSSLLDIDVLPSHLLVVGGVAANLLDNDPRRVSDRITAYNLYIDPPLGRAGMTEADVHRSGKPALMAKMATEDVSRAFEKGETQGFMKILVDRGAVL